MFFFIMADTSSYFYSKSLFILMMTLSFTLKLSTTIGDIDIIFI